jgi:hypothetical protein
MVEPEPAKLVMSAIFSEKELEKDLILELQALFGQVQMVSPRYPFSHTSYYEKEMGSHLSRRMFCFKTLIPEDRLVEVKLKATAVEDRFRDQWGRRRINLDPGVLSLGRVVLATHKPQAHRIYLGQGIYADLTLVFREGEYRPLQWTYPDYASEPLNGWLRRVRELYLWERRKIKEGGGMGCSGA